MSKSLEVIKGKVKFLTPIPYYSSPELIEKGLVIVDLEQLQNAQKEIDSSLAQYEREIREKIKKIEMLRTSLTLGKEVIYKDDVLAELEKCRCKRRRENMKVYLVTFKKYDYDQYDKFVVVAENEEDAFDLIKNKYPDKQFELIDYSGGYTVKEVEMSKKDIILGSYNAG